MKILVTGSSGHLGEALVRTLQPTSHEVVGVDLVPSPFTHHVDSIVDRNFVKRCMTGIDVVLHTATLHKPHIATHSRQLARAVGAKGYHDRKFVEGLYPVE